MSTFVIGETNWINTINTFETLLRSDWNEDTYQTLYLMLSPVANRFYLFKLYAKNENEKNEAHQYLNSASTFMHEMMDKCLTKN
jgi:hypothetical protein